MEDNECKKMEELYHSTPKLRSENALDWADRLSKKGLLDNHKTRWEYQKTVLFYMFQKTKSG